MTRDTTSTSHKPLSNGQLANALHSVADLLEEQAAHPPRIAAYRLAAHTIEKWTEPLSAVYTREGLAGLRALPSIGHSLAHSLEQLIVTGHLPLLDRLRGDFRAEKMFATVPDIGPSLAHRIHGQLHIETLLELYAAAVDGRLATVKGMGPKRILAVRESLNSRLSNLGHAGHEAPIRQPQEEVPLAELMGVDAEYREKAAADKLPRVAPRLFNPTGTAWLPILHTHRGKHHYTALFSNTARAHQLGTTHDWVVIYRDDAAHHGRWTAITAQFGSLRGKRIIRGREPECEQFYADAL